MFIFSIDFVSCLVMQRKSIILLLLLFAGHLLFAQEPPRPTKAQLAWQQLETTGFIHYGNATPKTFNPSGFDARQIIRVFRDAGLKMAIITAKHHGGFCLWPSKYTAFSVASSPWKNGQGDVVKEIADACREYGIKFGIYLSPWDKNAPSYGTPAYNDLFKNQLRELLTNYGEVAEVWFDGYKGKGAKPMDYDYPGFFRLVRSLQPNAVIFSDIGPDVRWVGNEKGNASETNWSTINIKAGMLPGAVSPAYLNRGDPAGAQWIPAETDVSIRPGWFYNPAHDTLIKSGKTLVDIYYRSVGRNSNLLLNVPPNSKGVISDADIASLRDFRSILDETFRTNLAAGSVPASLTDGQLQTFEIIPEGGSVVFDLKGKREFDRMLLQENIADGQRLAAAKVEYWDGKTWRRLAGFTTVGYKRLLRFPLVRTGRVRLTVEAAKWPVELAEVGFYKASGRE
ncbi:alpha-L-fucosidase [Chitinophaga cymbidii]|uniref:alpha-L-fucosidase n=2 Tax=Chitinophaga cymbidii TaxID=1096750 RepID=A0A512RR65_9BACT|nr:hypothetical protein CCY01nite_44530 [Chitinophaga cymbidii]